MELMCLICTMECKMYDQTIPSLRPKDENGIALERPIMRPAVTMCATNVNPLTLICYEHMAVQTQSPLISPNGVRLPPLPKDK